MLSGHLLPISSMQVSNWHPCSREQKDISPTALPHHLWVIHRAPRVSGSVRIAERDGEHGALCKPSWMIAASGPSCGHRRRLTDRAGSEGGKEGLRSASLVQVCSCQDLHFFLSRITSPSPRLLPSTGVLRLQAAQKSPKAFCTHVLSQLLQGFFLLLISL